MGIPGINLLNKAFTVISKQEVQFYAYTGRNQNTIGDYVSTFADPVPVRGSLQAVSRAMYEKLGLDLQKKYVTFYCSKLVLDLQRNTTPDEFTYAGRRYVCESANDWFAMDGWNGVLAVDIGAAT